MYHVYTYSITIIQTLIAEKAALLNYYDESDPSNVLHRQRRLVSVEREIIALTDKVCASVFLVTVRVLVMQKVTSFFLITLKTKFSHE